MTFFSKLGVPYVGSIMNIVGPDRGALQPELRSLLYRPYPALHVDGRFCAEVHVENEQAAGSLCGDSGNAGSLRLWRVLNYLVPSRVFEIVLNVAALGIIASWAFIVVCQMRLRKAIKEGKAADVSFKMPGAPVTSWLTLLFLFSVLVLMAFDYPNGTYTIATIPLLAVLLIAGWFGVRKRVHEIHSTAPVHHDDEKHDAPLVEETSR